MLITLFSKNTEIVIMSETKRFQMHASHNAHVTSYISLGHMKNI